MSQPIVIGQFAVAHTNEEPVPYPLARFVLGRILDEIDSSTS